MAVHILMERKDNVVSIAEYTTRRAQQDASAENPAGMQLVLAVRGKARIQLTDATERYSKIDEDAYASRSEARDRLTFLIDFNQVIAKAAPGGSVNLTKTVIDHGYDFEEAAETHGSGVNYIAAAYRAEAEYKLNMQSVSRHISDLQRAGLIVKTGFRRITPDAIDIDQEDTPWS